MAGVGTQVCTPLHSPGKGAVFQGFHLLQPVRRIRAYYGEEVALYFAWMNHFTCWLVLPAIAGLTYYTATKAAGLSVSNPAAPLRDLDQKFSVSQGFGSAPTKNRRCGR